MAERISAARQEPEDGLTDEQRARIWFDARNVDELAGNIAGNEAAQVSLNGRTLQVREADGTVVNTLLINGVTAWPRSDNAKKARYARMLELPAGYVYGADFPRVENGIIPTITAKDTNGQLGACVAIDVVHFPKGQEWGKAEKVKRNIAAGIGITVGAETPILMDPTQQMYVVRQSEQPLYKGLDAAQKAKDLINDILG